MATMGFSEEQLIERLRAIEALHAGATTAGERVAAERARQRIVERLGVLEREDPPIEYRFAMKDLWSRKVFIALLRRYGIQPYRYRGQRYTSVMARVSRRFVDETLWPEFEQLMETLNAYLADVTNRVVSQVLHDDVSEANEVEQPKQLELGMADDAQPGEDASAPGVTAGSGGTSPSTGDDTNRERNRRKRERAKRRKGGRGKRGR